MILLLFACTQGPPPAGSCLPGAAIGPGTPTWYADADADGHGDPGASVQSCDAPSGTVALGDDCDDDDPNTHPGADERCGGSDEDCDGETDEATAVDAPTWHEDADGDGWGAEGGTAACTAPDGTIADGRDCDDSDATISPEAVERCDGVDDDCDGLVDDADDPVDDPSTFYADVDGDGFGDPTAEQLACAAASGRVADRTDCDDTDPTVHPGGVEVCNTLDDDCNGHVDDAATDAVTWHPDGDGDGLGSMLVSVLACTQPAAFVADATDCDDGDAAVYPGAEERCDEVDGDCDGTVDEDAVDAGTWYADDDGDGFADPDDWVLTCERPAGWLLAEDALDCDDTSATVNPDGVETCDDGIDQDCDGFERPCPLAAPVEVGATAGDVWYGEAVGVRAGQAVAWADTDADGLDEAIIGVFQDSTYATFAGAVYAVKSTGGGVQSLAGAEVAAYGEVAYDYVGSSVSNAHDVDGDGYDDVLVGGYRSSANADYSGIAFLLPGPLVSMDLGGATATLFGEAENDEAGRSVAGLGDIDADGYGDIAVVAPGVDGSGTDLGAAYVLHGPVSGAFDLSAADSRILGDGTCGLLDAEGGDVDGDGVDDVVVGGPRFDGSRGAAWVLLSLPAGDVDISTADARLLGVAAGDLAGAAVALPGDVDKDGYGDLLVGAPYDASSGTDAGAAYLVLGPVAGDFNLAWSDATFLGDAAGDLTGTSVAGAGDVDGDARADLLVGSPGDDQIGITGGAVSILLGPLSGTSSIGDAAYATLLPYASVTEAGTSVAGGGDLDGDGIPDFLFGGPDFGDVLGGAGGAFLLLGADL